MNEPKPTYTYPRPHVTEHDEQQAVFDWATFFQCQHPELNLLLANANGQYRPGQRMEAGLKAGVPDIQLPIARGPYIGLWIELKVDSRQPSIKQLDWLHLLETHGHKTLVCQGANQTIIAIQAYLALKETDK